MRQGFIPHTENSSTLSSPLGGWESNQRPKLGKLHFATRPVYPACTSTGLCRFSPLSESITCALSIAPLVRSPPPLPTILLAGRHLAKTRGGKKGQISPTSGFCVFFSVARVTTGPGYFSPLSIFRRCSFLASLRMRHQDEHVPAAAIELLPQLMDLCKPPVQHLLRKDLFEKIRTGISRGMTDSWSQCTFSE
jgi:hypothetical protein